MQKEFLINKVLEYTDKVFFFCLKRCNNRMDAEDLSQTILLKNIVAINKGIEPVDFDYYFWRIAKNEYSKYVASKVQQRENEVLKEIIDEPADNINNLDVLINEERVAIINREIKLLSKDYSTILYRYYVEDMKLKTIADELNLPLGTVKYKLYQIRKKIEEAVKVEKLNGKKAYIPENYSFEMSCKNVGRYNPWSYVNTLINKNLLFHSYNNPCTLEDYALELGISLPYIEDLTRQLVEATLLKKIDNKYITDFAFISKENQLEIDQLLLTYKDEFGKKVIDFAEKIYDDYVNIGFEGANLPKGKLLWTLLLLIATQIEVWSDRNYNYTKRPGGAWDFLGYEVPRISFTYFVGQDTNENFNRKQIAYNIQHPRIKNKKIGNSEEVETLWLFYNKLPREYDKLLLMDDEVKNYVTKLIEKDLIIINDNKLNFNFPFFNKDEYKLLEKVFINDDMKSLVSLYNNIFNIVCKKIETIIPSYLDSQVKFIADSLVSKTRCFVLQVAEEMNLLDFAEDKKRFTANLLMISL